MAQLGERRVIKHGMKGAALARRGMLEGTINPAKGESMTDQETPERAHVTADDIEAANDLIDFIEACPSMFHTAATIMAELDEAGFTYLPENAAWDIEPGGRYYTQRNTSSVVAFKVGEDLAATWGEDGVAGDYHFQLTASHSDSPTFKVKAVPELDGAGETLRLNTEAYGGMIDYTWFDRPLALAGRVLVREGDRIESRLLATEREVAIIPSLAIHMNRGVNEGFAPNRAVDLCPLISAGELKQGDFDALIADELDVEPEQILGRDLFLVNRQDARIWGWADEFISTPKLDDLACAYTSLQAFLGAENAHDVSVFCCFDNEEVGSETKQGAMSTFLADALRRINGSLGFDDESYHRALAASMLVSCDNAHTVHPTTPRSAMPAIRWCSTAVSSSRKPPTSTTAPMPLAARCSRPSAMTPTCPRRSSPTRAIWPAAPRSAICPICRRACMLWTWACRSLPCTRATRPAAYAT